MDSTLEVFVYSPFRPSEIQLLSLLPGAAADPLNCTLTHVTLNISDTNDESGATDKDGQVKGEEPVYEALSYIWGPDEIYNFILVNSRKFPIRRNLWDALQRLRYPKRPESFGWMPFPSTNVISQSEVRRYLKWHRSTDEYCK